MKDVIPDQSQTELELLDQARQTLNSLGFEQIQLTEHQRILQIGLSDPDFETAIQMRKTIVAEIKVLGYRFATLDLTPDSSDQSCFESQSG